MGLRRRVQSVSSGVVPSRTAMAMPSTWELIYDRFDPEEPVIEHPEWRVARTAGPTESVTELMNLRRGPDHILLTGTPGSGKSTELHRIAESRVGREFVVMLDLDRHFTDVVGDPAALQKVAMWEVLFLVGIALIRAGEERLGLKLAKQRRELRDAWLRVSKAAGNTDVADVDMGALVRSTAVFASTVAAAAVHGPVGGAAAAGIGLLAAAKEAGGGFRWKLPMGVGGKSLPDQSDDLQGMVLVVNRILGAIQGDHPPVFLVLDGLDRIKDLGAARAMFVDSAMLSRLECKVVLCGPYALKHRPELAQVRGYRPRTLVNEPVLDQVDPTKHGPGIAVLRALYHNRVRDLADAEIAGELLDRLAYYSGGRARDFVRMIRMLAERMLLDRAKAVGAAQVEAVLDEARRLRETGLNRKHIKVLTDLARDASRQMPDEPVAWDLLQWECILPYPDGSEWFFPHPLLTMNLLKRWQPGSTESHA